MTPCAATTARTPVATLSVVTTVRTLAVTPSAATLARTPAAPMRARTPVRPLAAGITPATAPGTTTAGSAARATSTAAPISRAFVSPRRYRYSGWYAPPRGYYYRRWSPGLIFPSLFWASSSYFINSWGLLWPDGSAVGL